MAYPNASVTSSGVNWATFQEDGFSGLLEALITANLSATAAPTVAATLSETGSGGSLTAATYYCVVTETNAFGETTAGPVSSGQAITGTEELVCTYQSLKTGNTARNLYIGTSSSGPFTLAASGQTGSTTTILAPWPTNSYAVNPPTVNTTGLTYVDANGNTINKALELLRGFDRGDSRRLVYFISGVIRDFLRGDPMTFNAAMQKLNHFRGVVAMLNQLANEAGTLIDANAGTLGYGSVVGNLFPPPVRTWP